MREFAETGIGRELYAAIDAGFGFPGADDVSDLTDLQRSFLHHADVERQRAFLTALGEMFSE